MPYDLKYISIPLEILQWLWAILLDHRRAPSSIAMHSPQRCPLCELCHLGPTFSRSPVRFSSKSSSISIGSRVNRDLRPWARSSQFYSYSYKYYLPSKRVWSSQTPHHSWILNTQVSPIFKWSSPRWPAYPKPQPIATKPNAASIWALERIIRNCWASTEGAETRVTSGRTSGKGKKVAQGDWWTQNSNPIKQVVRTSHTSDTDQADPSFKISNHASHNHQKAKDLRKVSRRISSHGGHGFIFWSLSYDIPNRTLSSPLLVYHTLLNSPFVQRKEKRH